MNGRALKTITNNFGMCSFHVCLQTCKYDRDLVQKSFGQGDRGHLVSKVRCKWLEEKVNFCNISWFPGFRGELGS